MHTGLLTLRNKVLKSVIIIKRKSYSDLIVTAILKECPKLLYLAYYLYAMIAGIYRHKIIKYTGNIISPLWVLKYPADISLSCS